MRTPSRYPATAFRLAAPPPLALPPPRRPSTASSARTAGHVLGQAAGPEAKVSASTAPAGRRGAGDGASQHCRSNCAGWRRAFPSRSTPARTAPCTGPAHLLRSPRHPVHRIRSITTPTTTRPCAACGNDNVLPLADRGRPAHQGFSDGEWGQFLDARAPKLDAPDTAFAAAPLVVVPKAPKAPNADVAGQTAKPIARRPSLPAAHRRHAQPAPGGRFRPRRRQPGRHPRSRSAELRVRTPWPCRAGRSTLVRENAHRHHAGPLVDRVLERQRHKSSGRSRRSGAGRCPSPAAGRPQASAARLAAQFAELAHPPVGGHRDHLDRQRNAQRRSTSLLASAMQTKRSDCAATIFSRVSAAPPPLIMQRRGRSRPRRRCRPPSRPPHCCRTPAMPCVAKPRRCWPPNSTPCPGCARGCPPARR